MSLGVLVMWTDVVEEHEAEFTAWYSERLLPERLAIPGFCNVRRYAGAGSPKYLTYYETETAAVLAATGIYPAARSGAATKGRDTNSISRPVPITKLLA